MIKTTLLSLAFAATLLSSTEAQIVSWAETSPRMLTRIGLWNQAAQTVAGQFSIQYGTPIWKDEYDSMTEKAKGKSLRLGKDFWTTLDNDVPLKIGGVDVPVGQHCLGIACDEQGAFKLMIMNAATIKKYKADGWNTSKLKAKINAPLSYSLVKTKQKKLSIQFVQNKKYPAQAKLVIHWGKHQLTAKVIATLQTKTANASAKKRDREKEEAAKNH